MEKCDCIRTHTTRVELGVVGQVVVSWFAPTWETQYAATSLAG